MVYQALIYSGKNKTKRNLERKTKKYRNITE